MRYLIEMLPSEFWAAYAALARDRVETGEWPEPSRVHALAAEHEADSWALLVLTRGELPELDEQKQLTGDLVGIRNPQEQWTRPLVLAPTPAALVALQLCGVDLYCYVIDPWKRAVKLRELTIYAERWTAITHNRLAPARIETPKLALDNHH